MSDETLKDDSVETRCGYAALVGKPNVGKSTLLNTILGETISVVTAKPQTTRNRILAVHTTDEAQVIFLDTPGLHKPTGSLGNYMVESAEAAIDESDVLLWLIDVREPKRARGLGDQEKSIARRLGQSGKPLLAILNKIDILKNKQKLLPIMEELNRLENIEAIIPISALTGDGVETLLSELVARLPVGPKLYPEDMLSEQAERFFAAEIVRKNLTELTYKEIPYQSAVVIDKFTEEAKRCVIFATIHVERSSQRQIVLGSKGSVIKEIGTRSRSEIESFLQCNVDLRLHVEVSTGWTKNAAEIKKMGYE